MSEEASKSIETRIPVIRTAEDIDALPHLSEQEKALGKANLAMPEIGGGGDCLGLMGNDPEMQMVWGLTERMAEGLLEPDGQGIPYGLMNLISLQVPRLMKSEWLLTGFQLVTYSGTPLWDKEKPRYYLMGMLEVPDSEFWTDEQKTVLKFTEACMQNKMTDELFNHAKKLWGEKKMLRLIFYMGFVQTACMIADACHLRNMPGTEPASFNAYGPEAHEYFLKMNSTYMKSLRSLWDSAQSNKL
ncbi:MAG: hypothetical protein KJP07_08430 [Desulfatitalea sp.]|nr:hypothetical protein [Desulfatitalea sp.]